MPEPVVFPEDYAKTTKNIESLHSRGALSYALVSTIKSDGSSKVGDQTYLWGKVPAGLNMKLHSQTLATPEVLEEIAPYSFGQLMMETDFALGVGSAVKLVFQLPVEQKE